MLMILVSFYTVMEIDLLKIILKKEKALMEFKMTLIEYNTNFDWIEETLSKFMKL